MQLEAIDSIQELYKTESQTRVEFGSDSGAAIHYYADLVCFVEHVAPARQPNEHPDLLDVGCGNGWSTFCFANAGYTAKGLDLNPRRFEPPPTPGLTLIEGSALALPFPDDTFDLVTSYQCVEHLPDPALALTEMLRVLRPGGTVCIVGPNLLSPALSLKFFLRDARRGDLRWRRHPTTASHPYGNTASELLASLLTVSVRLLQKLLTRTPTFTMRTPDTVPPFHGDNDACYLCNPTDLTRFFTARGLSIVQNGKPGRPTFTALFAGGTWVAARKP